MNDREPVPGEDTRDGLRREPDVTANDLLAEIDEIPVVPRRDTIAETPFTPNRIDRSQSSPPPVAQTFDAGERARSASSAQMPQREPSTRTEPAIDARGMADIANFDPSAHAAAAPAPPTQPGSVSVSGFGNAPAPAGLFSRLRAAVSSVVARVKAFVNGGPTPNAPVPTTPVQTQTQTQAPAQNSAPADLDHSNDSPSQAPQLTREQVLERARSLSRSSRDTRGLGL